MKNFNLVELLRDCPTGMELDCLVFDNVTFDYVNTQQNRVYCKVDKSESVWFTPKGAVNLLPNAKCVIFPKGKTTWDGFVPPCKFKDGDVIAFNLAPNAFAIVHKVDTDKGEYNNRCMCHCFLNAKGWFAVPHICSAHHIRLATEEEKQKLFDAIKANGYKWNAETKTLEKLPKFKVGDRVYNKNYKDYIYDIHDITAKGYRAKEIDADSPILILFGSQEDNYELVPNKFDISTLKPFDKVLVRNTNSELWRINLFGCFSNEERYFMCMANSAFYQCIPYNEDTKHLVGTTDDCDEYYKTWEK